MTWYSSEYLDRIRERDPERAQRIERAARRQHREAQGWEKRVARARSDAAASLLCEMRAPIVRGLSREDCKAKRLCFLDGEPLPVRRLWWCSDRCAVAWTDQHQWTAARHAALKRDGHRCVRACGRAAHEVNHVLPRNGSGYHEGCHNHLAGLESLCGPCHRVETNRQRRERSVPA